MPTNLQLRKWLTERKRQVRKLEQRLSNLVIVEVPLPSGHYVDGKAIAPARRIAFQLSFVTRPSSRKDLFWYLGWKLGQALYLYGLGYTWQGLKDFLLASQSLRNKKGPDPSDLIALATYRAEIEEEISNDESG